MFVIVLENEGYATTFGDPVRRPLPGKTLPAQGALLENYYATGHESNDNYISLVSGQPPNVENQADCQVFTDFAARPSCSRRRRGRRGLRLSRLGREHRHAAVRRRRATWKAYEQDMGNDPNRETAACGHPALGAIDETQKAEAGDGYATRHDPFVYFHSVIDERRPTATHTSSRWARRAARCRRPR